MAITLRPPTFSAAKAPSAYTNPTIAWLSETWHVTHSTLPMWRSKRNVRIQYTPLEPSSASITQANTDRLDDLVSYQSLDGDKLHTIKGVDNCSSSGDARGEWDWRGKGLLKVASSHWEVLGWGEEEATGNKWVVTEFAKTLFTPAGIDVYSRDHGGVQPETLQDIKAALAGVGDEDVKELAGQLFEVKVDDARKE
ncbi:hypothetical protein LTR36_006746 [Oleoguttula mirabilis]|uniref:Uncharacterized protein n=1 Tax=Oleoguttula mirabilis TaxID=1507867 RepID=A0AAV9JC47_9PEZI|nr:hypothetical protein LTR36_006746 [Oleoguttula mirabilis]